MRNTLQYLAYVAIAFTLSMPPLDARAHNLGDQPAVGGPARYLEGRAATLAPMGHVVLCSRRPRVCATGSGPSVVDWTPELESVLSSVNRGVNSTVVQVSDANTGPLSDVWTVADGSGDCEDIALLKRERLIAAGVPSRTLRLAVARTASGIGHAVLLVRTSAGDVVLDNRHSALRLWTQTDLRWIKVQSAENPRRWQSV